MLRLRLSIGLKEAGTLQHRKSCKHNSSIPNKSSAIKFELRLSGVTKTVGMLLAVFYLKLFVGALV